MKNINLDELFENNCECYTVHGYPRGCDEEKDLMSKDKFKDIIMGYSKQLLELVAENVKTKDIMGLMCDDHTPYWGPCCTCGEVHNREIVKATVINKETITNTINQIIKA